jgi:hypothetical protein
MKKKRLLTLALLVAAFSYICPGQPNTYFVTNTADSGPGSLRQAIIDANNNWGQDQIQFNLPGPSYMIILSGPPTTLSDPNGVIIDGYTQPGASPNTQPQGSPSDAVLIVEIRSNNMYDAFHINSSSNTIKGLVINWCPRGIVIDGTGGFTQNNYILGCYIGTNVSGISAVPNTVAGIEVNNGAGVGMMGNFIGDGSNAGRNLISGNGTGVIITDPSTLSTYVVGNYIGTNVNGNQALGNTNAGILIQNGASYSMIGSTISGQGNVISRNAYGVHIIGTGTSYNTVIGNRIGTDITGTTALGNWGSGVRIESGATDNKIGLYNNTAYKNIISGNGYSLVFYDGVDILGSGTSNNTVDGNYIGTDVTGSTAIPNALHGITIFNSATSNTIGGWYGNVISGNSSCGLWIEGMGTDLNSVYANIIGLDATGTTALPNNLDGVLISNGAQNNSIGIGVIAYNFISGNLQDGIRIENLGTDFNSIKYNCLGLDMTFSALGNGGNGVHIRDLAQFNQVGGTGITDHNLIQYNTGHGVLIDDASFNSVISDAVSGISALSQIMFSGGDGIAVTNSNSLSNTFSQNIIDNNTGLGIDLGDDGVTSNDPNDPDLGPNKLLNFPVITYAHLFYSGPFSNTVVTGTVDIDSNPLNATVEVYSMSVQDPSGYGEGPTFIGTAVPDASGFWLLFGPWLNQGDYVTAIVIDGSGNTSEFSANMVVKYLDFGDAPDSPYLTLYQSNGARHHVIAGAPWLGDAFDAPDEDDNGICMPPTPPFPCAQGDDQNGWDDENGVTFSNFYAGMPASVTFEVQNGPAYVDGWVDYNASGIWGDMSGTEYIVSATYASGVHTVALTVPVNAAPQITFARFRINSSGALTPTGEASDGEVEDYEIPLAGLWIGGTSGSETNWATAGNWSNNTVPLSNHDAVIPAGCTHYPVISGNADCYNLLIEDGATVTMASGANFIINGALTIGQGSSGTLIVNGGYGKVIFWTTVNNGGSIQMNGGTFKP